MSRELMVHPDYPLLVKNERLCQKGSVRILADESVKKAALPSIEELVFRLGAGFEEWRIPMDRWLAGSLRADISTSLEVWALHGICSPDEEAAVLQRAAALRQRIEKEIQDAGDVCEMVPTLCVLERIHLHLVGDVLVHSFEFSATWAHEHGISLLFTGADLVAAGGAYDFDDMQALPCGEAVCHAAS